MTPSASYSKPKVDENTFELEARNDGQRPEISYTPAPAKMPIFLPEW